MESARIKFLECAALVSRHRAGKAFMALEKGEKPLVPAKVGAGATALAAVSSSGRLLLFPLADTKTMAKGRGTTLQALEDKDEMAAVAVGADSFVVSGTGRGGKPAESTLMPRDARTTKANARARGMQFRCG